MDELKELISLCRASVTISINEHRDSYESVEEYLQFIQIDEKDVRSEMIKRDVMISVQCYINTPIGSIIFWHYDLDECIKEALKEVKTLTKERE